MWLYKGRNTIVTALYANFVNNRKKNLLPYISLISSGSCNNQQLSDSMSVHINHNNSIVVVYVFSWLFLTILLYLPHA